MSINAVVEELNLEYFDQIFQFIVKFLLLKVTKIILVTAIKTIDISLYYIHIPATCHHYEFYIPLINKGKI